MTTDIAEQGRRTVGLVRAADNRTDLQIGIHLPSHLPQIAILVQDIQIGPQAGEVFPHAIPVAHYRTFLEFRSSETERWIEIGYIPIGPGDATGGVVVDDAVGNGADAADRSDNNARIIAYTVVTIRQMEIYRLRDFRR
ncbi:hypothetical protein [Nocardia sp. NPDC051570]|uniref:hypothetical protein n=1 Tax=Nocardia sp. NPDC051570 TaxID=3364324 RepID=UPI0037A09AA1